MATLPVALDGAPVGKDPFHGFLSTVAPISSLPAALEEAPIDGDAFHGFLSVVFPISLPKTVLSLGTSPYEDVSVQGRPLSCSQRPMSQSQT